MLKVIFDTNVLISALLFDNSATHKFYNSVKKGEFDLYLSDYILEEFEKVCLEKFSLDREIVYRHIRRLRAIATIVYPKKRVNIIKGKTLDNKILECVLEVEADYLVTGDKKHILPLGKFKNTRIVSPSEFLSKLNGF